VSCGGVPRGFELQPRKVQEPPHATISTGAKESLAASLGCSTSLHPASSEGGATDSTKLTDLSGKLYLCASSSCSEPAILAHALEDIHSIVNGALDVVHVVVGGTADHDCAHAALLVANLCKNI